MATTTTPLGEGGRQVVLFVFCSHLSEKPPAQVLAAAVSQPEDEVRDAVLSHVGSRALPAQRAHLHVLVERFSQRALVVIPADVSGLHTESTKKKKKNLVLVQFSTRVYHSAYDGWPIELLFCIIPKQFRDNEA